MILPDQIPSSDTIINGTDTASALVNQYIVAPIAQLGIAGFNLTITKTEKSEFDSDITDHYVEKNIAVQDHIALKPEMYVITGFVGELVYQNTKSQSQIQKLAQKLTTISGFLPIISDTMKQLQTSIINGKAGGGLIDYLNASLGAGIDLYQTFQKINPPKTQQAKAYNYFLALRNARQLISFNTPYGFKANYVIKNFFFFQPEKTEGYSEVEFTMKQFRTVTTKTVAFDSKKYQGRTAAQQSLTANKGNTQGIGADFVSTIKKFFN